MFGRWRCGMVSSFSKLGLTSKSSLIRFSSLCSGDPWWCTLPFREVNIGCVESHWHVRGVTFTSAERVARAPAARQLEISAGMQNLITTLIFTLSLLLSLCLSVSSLWFLWFSSFLMGAAHLHIWWDLIILSCPPHRDSLHSYFPFFTPASSLYTLLKSFTFFPFVRGHHESSSTALPIPSKG